MPDLTFLSATEMAKGIREKQLSPVELIEAHLSRIETLNPKMNAFVQLAAERARSQAQAAETAVMGGKVWGRYMAFQSASRVRLRSQVCAVRRARVCGQDWLPRRTLLWSDDYGLREQSFLE